MKYYKNFLIILIPGMLFGFGKVGINGVKILDIPVGARAVGMGQAFTAISGDPSSVFWNPASTAMLKGINVFAHHINWWAGTSINTVSLVKGLGLSKSAGIFINSFNSGEFEATTVEYPDGSGQFVSYNAWEAGLHYAQSLTDKFSFGINLKMLRENYPTDNPLNPHYTQGIAFDVGSFYYTGYKRLRIGIAVFNFGGDLVPHGTYTNYADGEITNSTKKFRSYPLPISFRGGIAFEPIETENSKLTIAIDGIHPSDNVERLNIGMEYLLLSLLYFRCGFEMNKDVGGFNAGIGLSRNLGDRTLRFDYAFSSGGYLPSINRVSITTGF